MDLTEPLQPLAPQLSKEVPDTNKSLYYKQNEVKQVTESSSKKTTQGHKRSTSSLEKSVSPRRNEELKKTRQSADEEKLDESAESVEEPDEPEEHGEETHLKKPGKPVRVIITERRSSINVKGRLVVEFQLSLYNRKGPAPKTAPVLTYSSELYPVDWLNMLNLKQPVWVEISLLLKTLCRTPELRKPLKKIISDFEDYLLGDKPYADGEVRPQNFWVIDKIVGDQVSFCGYPEDFNEPLEVAFPANVDGDLSSSASTFISSQAVFRAVSTRLDKVESRLSEMSTHVSEEPLTSLLEGSMIVSLQQGLDEARAISKKHEETIANLQSQITLLINKFQSVAAIL